MFSKKIIGIMKSEYFTESLGMSIDANQPDGRQLRRNPQGIESANGR